MKDIRVAAAAGLGCLCVSAILNADTLVLRDGRRVDGDLVAVHEGVVEFDAQRSGFFGGREHVRVDRDEVVRIELDDRAARARDRDAAAGRDRAATPTPGAIAISANAPRGCASVTSPSTPQQRGAIPASISAQARPCISPRAGGCAGGLIARTDPKGSTVRRTTPGVQFRGGPPLRSSVVWAKDQTISSLATTRDPFGCGRQGACTSALTTIS